MLNQQIALTDKTNTLCFFHYNVVYDVATAKPFVKQNIEGYSYFYYMVQRL